MRCISESCPSPDNDSLELMLVCSVNPEHAAHVTCWANWAAQSLLHGSENQCLDFLCIGVATNPPSTNTDEARNLIFQAMPAPTTLDLGEPSYDAETYATSFDFGEPPASALTGTLEPLFGVEPAPYEDNTTGMYGFPEYPGTEHERPAKRVRLNSQEESSESSDDSDEEQQPDEEQQSSDEELAQLPPGTFITECTACSDDLTLNVAGDDYAGGGAWWCSGDIEHRNAAVYCTGCKDMTIFCRQCQAYSLVLASRRHASAPVLFDHPFERTIPIPGKGKRQTGMLCYAAATATAVRWVTGQDLSVYECMHAFLMSGQADGSDANIDYYRRAYITVTSEPAYQNYTSGQIIENVFRTAPGYEYVLPGVTSLFGSPVFPNNVTAQLRYSLSSDELRDAIAAYHPVLKGEGNHWTVIYGVRGPDANHIISIVAYDPMSDSLIAEAWSPDLKADYYVVG